MHLVNIFNFTTKNNEVFQFYNGELYNLYQSLYNYIIKIIPN